ncbi:Uma2 family endonuclease [Streptomyces sp. NPDC048603]|uniref:Uma2 family endonuclease n=1 Tax=Streptomyces sp. NPDC048603 TaxID=3365577 RepID=UPI003722E6C7
MTVVENDRIEMAMSNPEPTLDEIFAGIEKAFPEGYRFDVVEGNIFMSPQRPTHWDIIADIYEQLRTEYPRKRILSDVRIDYPGYLNGFCSDVTLLREGATADENGRYACEDVLFVGEVVSKRTGMNDYGPKKEAYAAAGVAVYLVADPYTGRCKVYSHPKDGEYMSESKFDFGDVIDLTDTDLGLTISTAEFPRD